MALSASFWGDNADPVQAPQPQAQPMQQPQHQAGGLGGFLFNNFIKPTVKSVGGALSDAAKVPEAIYGGGKVAVDAATTGIGSKATQNALKSQNKLLSGTNFRQNYEDPNLQKAVGKSTGQVLNLTAPVAGGETLGAKAGIKALAGSGLKTGAKLGAVSGAANSMAQGQSGGDVINSALSGGALGAGVGLAGGVTGAAAGKILGRAGDVAAQSKPGILQRFANKQATKQAQNVFADQVQSEFGNGGKLISGNGTPINNVLAQMQSHRIDPTVQKMNGFGNAGYAYNDVLNNAIVPKGTPVQLDLNQVIKGSFNDQPGLGAVGTRGTQATQIAQGLRNTIQNSLDPTSENLSGIYHPGDLLKAAQDLYNAHPASKAEAQVYSNARKALINAAGNEGGLNQAIKEYKLPTVEDVMQNKISPESQPARDVQHIVEMSGHNPTLAQQIVDNINKSGSIQDIQKSELPHIAANELAQSHAEAIGKTLPQPENSRGSYSMTGMGGLSTAYELGSLAHGNIAAAIPLAAKAGGGNPLTRMIGRAGTVDESQVGVRPAPSLNGEAPGVAPAQTEISPSPTQPSGNVLSRLQNPGAVQGATGALTGMGAVQGGNILSGLSGGQQQPTQPGGGFDQSVLGATDQTQQQPTQPQSEYSQQNMMADIQRDPKNASTYMSLYKTMNPASSQKTLTTGQQNMIESLRGAIGGLTPYSEQLQQVSNSGPAGGRLESLLGSVGLGGENAAAIHSLDTSRTEIATQIAKALTGSKPAATIVRSWEQAIPSVTDTPAVRQEKWNMLAQRLQGELQQVTQPIGNPDSTQQLLDQLQSNQLQGATQ